MESSKSTERPVYIYALVDPRDDEVRYVGQSLSPRQRLKDHLKEARGQQKTARARWLSDLVSKSLEPTLVLLEECSRTTWEEAERRWIAHYHRLGCQLVNATSGGRGVHGLRVDARTWLDDNKIMAIRYEYAAGESSPDLARKYSTTHGNIRFIVTGRTWKHLPLISTEHRIPANKHPRGATGDKNGMRTHPERNGQKSHPEQRARGARNGNARLTDAERVEIIKAHAAGSSRADLARRFRVNWSTINGLVQGRFWLPRLNDPMSMASPTRSWSGQSKVTQSQREAIVIRLSQGLSRRQVAHEFGVSTNTVCKIANQRQVS